MAEKTKALSLSDRFTNSVVSAYQDIAKGVLINTDTRRLIANYFIQIDKTLKNSKNGLTWQMVKMPELSLTVAHMSRLGLDMSLPNMISFLPFKDKSNRIDMVPVIGAKGYDYLAKRYGLTPPKSFTVELVYDSDYFECVKKDSQHERDDYVFQIKKPFNRGKIIGGFGYLEFEDSTLNKLLVMSEEEILKYRPSYYDKNFWSGENLKKMYEKTIAKQLLKKVTLDPDKVNDVSNSFAQIDKAELELTCDYAQEEINAKQGNGDIIDISADWEEAPTESQQPVEKPVENVDNADKVEVPKQDTLF